MEPGYPRSVSKDFGGLSGRIVAALSVPANRKRPEIVYFFKKGEGSDHDSEQYTLTPHFASAPS